jgi:hypothetical protein
MTAQLCWIRGSKSIEDVACWSALVSGLGRGKIEIMTNME